MCLFVWIGKLMEILYRDDKYFYHCEYVKYIIDYRKKYLYIERWTQSLNMFILDTCLNDILYLCFFYVIYELGSLYNKTWCNSGIIQVIIFLLELNKDLWNSYLYKIL